MTFFRVVNVSSFTFGFTVVRPVDVKTIFVGITWLIVALVDVFAATGWNILKTNPTIGSCSCSSSSCRCSCCGSCSSSGCCCTCCCCNWTLTSVLKNIIYRVSHIRYSYTVPKNSADPNTTDTLTSLFFNQNKCFFQEQ